MCWFIKLEPTSRPVRSEQYHGNMSELSPFNSTTETVIHSLCHPPSEPCDNTSRKVLFKYCIYGDCCQNRGVGEEFCACIDPSFIGDRCDELDILAASTAGGSSPFLFIGIAVVLVIVIGIALAAFGAVCCYKRRQPRTKQTSETKQTNDEEEKGDDDGEVVNQFIHKNGQSQPTDADDDNNSVELESISAVK